MQLSISTGFFYKYDFRTILDVIYESGCKNIELFLNQSFLDISTSLLSSEIKKRNLKVLSVHTPLEFCAFPKGETEDYWITKGADLCRFLGASLLVTHMIWDRSLDLKKKEILDEEHKKNLEKRWGESSDIVITTENMPFILKDSFLGNAKELKIFLEKNKGHLTFDTTHYGTFSSSIVEFFDDFFPFIRNIHLSDGHEGKEHMTLGTGTLPLEKFLRNLKKKSYDGVVTLEMDFDNKARNHVSSPQEAVTHLRSSLEFFYDIIQS